MTIYIWQNDHQMALWPPNSHFPELSSSWTVSNNQNFQKMTEILIKTFQEQDETLMKDCRVIRTTAVEEICAAI